MRGDRGASRTGGGERGRAAGPGRRPGRGDRGLRHLGRGGTGRPTRRAAPGLVDAAADARRESRRGREGAAGPRRDAAVRRLRPGPARAVRGGVAAPGGRRRGGPRRPGDVDRVAPSARRRTGPGRDPVRHADPRNGTARRTRPRSPVPDRGRPARRRLPSAGGRPVGACCPPPAGRPASAAISRRWSPARRQPPWSRCWTPSRTGRPPVRRPCGGSAREASAAPSTRA